MFSTPVYILFLKKSLFNVQLLALIFSKLMSVQCYVQSSDIEVLPRCIIGGCIGSDSYTLKDCNIFTCPGGHITH